jgi:KDO2-lipid IV(A) lauroyltransferase
MVIADFVRYSRRVGSFFSKLLVTASTTLLLWNVRGIFAFLHLLGPERASAWGGAFLRTFGPWFPVHKVAYRNLKQAFPEKSEAEVHRIAVLAWDNLGRTAAEYAHLSALVDSNGIPPHLGRVTVSGVEHFLDLLHDDKPAIIFSAHLANWELPAICAACYGLNATAVFRPPNNKAIASLIGEIRGQTMGNLAASGGIGGVFAMRRVLEDGGRLGMLIDQHLTRGLPVDFFGRSAKANPILAKLARHFDCPVHGVRVIRLPDVRFRVELTPPLDLPRDDSGKIDVDKAIQVMTHLVEGWVREYPDQWLWMHRRWR